MYRVKQFHQNLTRPPIGPMEIFNIIYLLYRTSESKNQAETRSRYGETAVSAFFPCVPCVSTSHSPASPVPLAPNSTLQHFYTTFIMLNSYILKQRSIGASSEMHLFPAKVGAKYALGPTQPPRMPNFQQMSMV